MIIFIIIIKIMMIRMIIIIKKKTPFNFILELAYILQSRKK